MGSRWYRFSLLTILQRNKRKSIVEDRVKHREMKVKVDVLQQEIKSKCHSRFAATSKTNPNPFKRKSSYNGMFILFIQSTSLFQIKRLVADSLVSQSPDYWIETVERKKIAFSPNTTPHIVSSTPIIESSPRKRGDCFFVRSESEGNYIGRERRWLDRVLLAMKALIMERSIAYP